MKTTQYIHRQSDRIVVLVPYLRKGVRHTKSKNLFRVDFVSEKEMFEEAVWWRNYFIDRFGRSYQEHLGTPKPSPVPEGSCEVLRKYNIRASVRADNAGGKAVYLTAWVTGHKGKRFSFRSKVNRDTVDDKLQVLIARTQCVLSEPARLNKRVLNNALRRFNQWVEENNLSDLMASPKTKIGRKGLPAWLTREEKRDLYGEHDLRKIGMTEGAFMLLDDVTVEHCLKSVS